MKQAYLLLAFERHVLKVVLDDDIDAIQQAIGYQTVEHGTTFQTEDHEVGGAPSDQFWVAGVPLPFSGNAILVGVDLTTGDTADRPVMSIDEFRTAHHVCWSPRPASVPVLSSASNGLLMGGPISHASKQAITQRTSRRQSSRQATDLGTDHPGRSEDRHQQCGAGLYNGASRRHLHDAGARRQFSPT